MGDKNDKTTTDFITACKFVKNITPLNKNTKYFSKWKNAVTAAIESFQLTEKEQKLIVIKAVDKEYFSYCLSTLNKFKKKSVEDFINHIKNHYGFDNL